MSSFTANHQHHKSYPQVYLNRQKDSKIWRQMQLPDDFHWYVYREHNHDLFLHNIRTQEQLENHWLTRGRLENRSYHWDNRKYHNIYSRIDANKISPLTKRYNKIVMITQFFISPNEERNREVQRVLEENCANAEIDEIHLLNEEYFDLPVLQHPKIRQFNLGKRLSYYDAFYYSHMNLGRDVVKILCNNDMTYDAADLQCLRYYNFEPLWNMKKVMCLLRYEKTREQRTYLSHTLVRDGKAFSADTWIYVDINPSKQMDFYLGLLACDIRIAKLLETHKYTPINPCLSIRSYHNHFSGFRKSTQATRVKGEYKRLDVLLDEEIERIREQLLSINANSKKDANNVTDDATDDATNEETNKKIYKTNAKQWVLQDDSSQLWKHILNIIYLNQWSKYIEMNNIYVIYIMLTIHKESIKSYIQSANIIVKSQDEIGEEADFRIVSNSLTGITLDEFSERGQIQSLSDTVIAKYGEYWKQNILFSNDAVAATDDKYLNLPKIENLLYEDAEYPIRYESIANQRVNEFIRQGSIQLVVIVDIQVMKEEMNQWIACIRELSKRYKLITTAKIAEDIPSYQDYSLQMHEILDTFRQIPHYITFTEKNEYYFNLWNMEIRENLRNIFIYADYRKIPSASGHNEIEYEAVLMNELVEQEINNGENNGTNNENNKIKTHYFTDSILVD